VQRLGGVAQAPYPDDGPYHEYGELELFARVEATLFAQLNMRDGKMRIRTSGYSKHQLAHCGSISFFYLALCLVRSAHAMG